MAWEADVADDVVVSSHGSVSQTDQAYARTKVARLWRHTSAPIVFAKIDLRMAADPARSRPAEARAEVDLNGRVVCAHATSATFFEAIDMLDTRLRRQIRRLEEREQVHRRRPN